MEITIPIHVLYGAFSAIAAVISVLAMRASARTAAEQRALSRQLKASPHSRIESLELRLDELATAIGDVANRVKMQRVRNAANHVDDNPSSKLDKLKANPEAWRAEMGKRIARGWRPGSPVSPGED